MRKRYYLRKFISTKSRTKNGIMGGIMEGKAKLGYISVYKLAKYIIST